MLVNPPSLSSDTLHAIAPSKTPNSFASFGGTLQGSLSGGLVDHRLLSVSRTARFSFFRGFSFF